jgi:hypothetical protein
MGPGALPRELQSMSYHHRRQGLLGLLDFHTLRFLLRTVQSSLNLAGRRPTVTTRSTFKRRYTSQAHRRPRV